MSKARELAESIRRIIRNNADGHLSLHEVMVLREAQAFLELSDMFLSKEGKVSINACLARNDISSPVAEKAP